MVGSFRSSRSRSACTVMVKRPLRCALITRGCRSESRGLNASASSQLVDAMYGSVPACPASFGRYGAHQPCFTLEHINQRSGWIMLMRRGNFVAMGCGPGQNICLWRHWCDAQPEVVAASVDTCHSYCPWQFQRLEKWCGIEAVQNYFVSLTDGLLYPARKAPPGLIPCRKYPWFCNCV